MKWIRKRDLYVIIALMLIASILYVGYRIYTRNLSAKAEIYYKSQLVKTVLLNTGKEETFQIEESDHVVFHLYADGSISFEESDCPDQICVKTGRIRYVGQSAACLPNNIIIKIVSVKNNTSDDLDMIR